MNSDETTQSTDQELPLTLTDSEIVTERKSSRRAFFVASGVLLAGGALALISNEQAQALQQPRTDPDSKKTDPNSKKTDPDSKKHHQKGSDPDSKKGSDPDSKKTPKKPS